MSKRSNTLVTVLKIFWFLSILTSEYISFWKAASECSPWPQLPARNGRSMPSDRVLNYIDHKEVPFLELFYQFL
jgi:hypothetical protein